MAARGGPFRKGSRSLLEPLLGLVLAAVVAATLWLSFGGSFTSDGAAAVGGGGTALRASVTREGTRARLSVLGGVRRGGSGAPVAVRVLGRTDVASPCPTPTVTGGTQLFRAAGSVRVGWRAASGLRPGDALERGRRFAMVGTVSLPGDAALRLCVHLVRGGPRPTVLRSVRVVVPSASGITPLAVAVAPLTGRGVGRALALLLVACLVGLALRAVQLRSRRRRSRRRSGAGAGYASTAFGTAGGAAGPPTAPDGPGGPAGRSAQAVGERWLAGWQARRRREASAEGRPWDPDEPVPQHVAAWTVGAEGERLAAERFARIGGLFPQVRVLHDRRQVGRPRANIDHLLVGPAGVVVADTKNRTGEVRIADGRLRVRGRDRTVEVEKVREQVLQVQRVLDGAGLGVVPIVGVLHWIQTDGIALDGSLALRGVPLLDAFGTLSRAVGRTVLDEDGIDRVARALERELPPAGSPLA